jgi:hypothetical protein
MREVNWIALDYTGLNRGEVKLDAAVMFREYIQFFQRKPTEYSG